MITYAHAVVWIWTIALLATLAGLALVWRALARADAAVAALRVATDSLQPLDPATQGLRHDSLTAADLRDHLVDLALPDEG